MMTGGGTQARGFDRIVIDGTDDEGREIGRIYAKATGRYAVYSTIERVQVLYADDPEVQREQRRQLSTLACLRSEIDGALAPWRRASSRWRLGAAAQQYDGRIAAALVEALEGNLDSARQILAMVRGEITCERTSRAQLYYLLSTIVLALVFLIPCTAALAGKPAWAAVATVPAQTVWLAVTAGVVGSVYSIALSLRKRDVTNDRRWLEHVTDVAVRLCIGAIAGFVVAELLLTGALQLKLGEVALTLTGDQLLSTTPNVAFVLLAGFLAGFAERFVPDLLNSYKDQRVPSPAPTPPVGARPLPPGGSAVAALPASAPVPDGAPNGTQDDGSVAGQAPPPEPTLDAAPTTSFPDGPDISDDPPTRP